MQNDGEYIDDVQLTEKGDWLILYGDCGVVYNNLPDGLVEMINYYNENRMVITTITFNDYGDWIIIAWDGFTASSTDIKDLIKNGQGGIRRVDLRAFKQQRTCVEFRPRIQDSRLGHLM